MSERDYIQYHHFLPDLAGRKVFITLATNSIKLHIDEKKSNGCFLWIDPPWEFKKDGQTLESSESCPWHEEEGYETHFKEWVSKFKPLYETSIEYIEASPKGNLEIKCCYGYSILVPEYFFSDDDDSWYDHWYYRESGAV